ncbi:hypothetical protein [Fulvivirga sedimenti]|uniref:Uncharacterized protein n=1 Tax=Fulvivirga sedimenti TaxID=2879465 RepID=A0A9X1KXE2_9BACT|nr:hypothetical protein [Fulvivirga sedimenti]MCA6074528.1 hypothetical protein [Fulvivirga sedimenti]MCA6075705.1 hypothetical protein [Fulvivirga sedimenti]MCA6076833.1 hypothetical protein [Fulvivirga sedimenti]
MRNCSSGKVCHDNRTIAEEELVRVLAKYGERAGSPNGIYLCEICGFYHLTSSSRETGYIHTPEFRERIRRAALENDWDDRWK